MDKLFQYYKHLYDFDNWPKYDNSKWNSLKPFSLQLDKEDKFQRISQSVLSAMWGESLYTHREILRKDDIEFHVTIYPYHTVEKAKNGMLLRMIASIPFEKTEDITISDLCFIHLGMPNSFLLFLCGSTMIEISTLNGRGHMDDIKELAKLITGQMKDVRSRLPRYGSE